MLKKGVFFSTDALIAISIIIIVVIAAYPIIQNNNRNSKIHYDILTTLSDLKVNETNNAYLSSLISSGLINDTSKTLLEQIGEFSVTNKTIARSLTASVLQDLDTNENVGLWFGDELIYSNNKTPYDEATKIDVARQIISGIQEGQSITGYSARAYLTNSLQSKYVFFGGYIGDGNISYKVDYSGNISSAQVEITTNKDFQIYINNVYQGTYSASNNDTTPVKYNLSTSNFHSGNNTLEFRADNLYIAGGFIKINYNPDILYQQPNRYYFPGIDGLINIYDGISIPGQLHNMSVYLHYRSNYSLFLTVANSTLFNSSSPVETTQTIPDSSISSSINYDSISNKTIPIRLGLENISLTNSFSGNADIILITDTSGSMAWRMDSDNTGTNRNCNDSLLNDPSTSRISVAKCIDKDFISTILAGNGSRIGLVSFSTNLVSSVNLTTDGAALNTSINSYSATGSTCISCAINQAYLMLQAQSNSSRTKFVIVMTDGVPNQRSTLTCYNSNSISSNLSFLTQSGDSGFLGQNSGFWNVTTPTTINFYATSVINSTLAYSVGSSGEIYKFDGNSWSLQQDIGSTTLYALSMLNSTLGYSAGSSGRIYKFNGSWNLQQTVSGLTWYGLDMYNSTLGYVVGEDSNSGEIYKLSSGTWSSSASVTGVTFYGIDMYNSTFAFATGSSGKIYKLSGSSWAQDTDLGSMTVTSVKIFNSTLAYATTSNGRIYRWSGSSWSSVYSGSYSLNSITIINSTSAYASGDSRGGIVELSSGTWTSSFDPYFYSGNLTTGKDCNDNDVCSLTQSVPMLNTNYSACRLHDNLNATINSVGFGPFSSCNFAVQTLQNVASCGNGTFYASSNTSLLQAFYQNLAQQILNISYAEQNSLIVGNISTILYPDSYIEYGYTSQSTTNQSGLILTFEQPFSNSTSGSFSIPQNTTVIDARVVSYSGSKWTDEIKINNNLFYDLSEYLLSYIKLGDPYSILIPISSINLNSVNNISLKTGINSSSTSPGSSSNKIIYSVSKNASTFSSILTKAEGCYWNIEFEDLSSTFMNVPSSPITSNSCYYNSTGYSYDNNDAYQTATYNLLRSIDSNLNGRVDAKFVEDNLQISPNILTGIPYTWGTEVQVRIWN